MSYSPRSETRSRAELKINTRDLLELVFHQFITYIQPYAGLLVPYTSTGSAVSSVTYIRLAGLLVQNTNDLLEVLFRQ